MRPRLVLVRHGATEWALNGRHTGRTDLDLLPEGEEQAIALAPRLAGFTFTRVLVSPLRRARRTAELAGYHDVEVVAELAEWDYGATEGRTTMQMRDEVPGWDLWRSGVVGGETIEQVAARARVAIDKALSADGDVLMVAHGHLLRILATQWCRLEPRHAHLLQLDPATVSVLGWKDDDRVIWRWNDHGSDRRIA